MYCFKKTQRLLNKYEFDNVFSTQNKLVTTEFIILYKVTSQKQARLGMVISKKITAKACQRNRLKRLLRESFRVQTLSFVDIVVLARHGVAQIENKLINTNLNKAWKKLANYLSK